MYWWRNRKQRGKEKYEKINTPHVGTIDELTNYLQENPEKFVKTLIYNVDGKFYACMVQETKM